MSTPVRQVRGLELRDVGYFVVLAEELHFTRAARRLHLAQPALSVALQRLERQVGARLVDRTSRSVALTDAGTNFLPHARDLLERAELAVEAARSR
jgi:LysR family transcriptional regulator, benzoate and cis,cis-muconate-responsive activator of ben and cat genes